MSIAKRIIINQDREGMLKRSLERIIQLYTDKSHFIYELLQNAEDAKASSILFVAKAGCLEVLHNGVPFTFKNLQALCDIGKSDKIGDLNKIGEFGVGFKSVFGICKSVKLYSQPRKQETESFAIEIEDFTYPVDIQQEEFPDEYTTKFVFPYCIGESFSGFKTIDALRKAIETRLKSLGYSTLLFMHHLQSIKYTIEQDDKITEGKYSITREQSSPSCSKVYSGNAQDRAESHYLVYSKTVPEQPSRTVDIAYYMEKGSDGNEQFARSDDPYISVFFPTETESKLNFIVQGPFRTTPNRSSIPFDDEENIKLASLIADLLYESVLDIKQKGLLSLRFLSLLPMEEPDRVVNWLFLPLLSQVKRLMIEENILPTSDGDFTNVNHAVLARGQGLAKVFHGTILHDFMNRFEDEYDLLFFEDGEAVYGCSNDDYEPTHTLIPYKWLDTRLTENNFSKLFRFLCSDLDVTLVRPEQIGTYISQRDSFFDRRDEKWIEHFYQFLLEQSKTSDILNPDRSTARNMMLMPFVKTSTGNFVAPYREVVDSRKLYPNIYLPTSRQIGGLQYIDRNIYEKFTYLFKNILRLSTPDEFSYFLTYFKKNYQKKEPKVDLSQHCKDIETVLLYLEDPNRRQDMKSALVGAEYILCTDNIFRNPHKTKISVPILENNTKAEEYFLPGTVSIVSERYSIQHIKNDSLKELGVIISVWINTEPLDWHERSYDQRVQVKDDNGFASQLDLLESDNILRAIREHSNNNSAKFRSRIVFNLLCSNSSKLQGYIIVGKGIRARELVDSRIVEKLKRYNNRWLYTKAGTLVRSVETSKYNLDEKLYGPVRHDSIIYDILGFIKTDLDDKNDAVAQVLQGDILIREAVFEKLLSEKFGITVSKLEKLIREKEIESPLSSKHSSYYSPDDEVMDFPSRPVLDMQRLISAVERDHNKAIPVRYEERPRRVRITEQPDQNKAYIKSMYRCEGNNEETACQMCEQITYYPHAVQIEREMKLELSCMYLSLCPNCAEVYRSIRNNVAKFEEFMLELRNDDKLSDNEPLHISCGEETLAFTATHLAEIQQHLRLQEESRQPKFDEMHQQSFGTIYPSQQRKVDNVFHKPALEESSKGIKNDHPLQNRKVVHKDYGVGIINAIEFQENKVFAEINFANKSTTFDLEIALQNEILSLIM